MGISPWDSGLVQLERGRYLFYSKPHQSCIVEFTSDDGGTVPLPVRERLLVNATGGPREGLPCAACCLIGHQGEQFPASPEEARRFQEVNAWRGELVRQWQAHGTPRCKNCGALDHREWACRERRDDDLLLLAQARQKLSGKPPSVTPEAAPAKAGAEPKRAAEAKSPKPAERQRP